MRIIDYPAKWHYTQTVEKRQIVLHFTAGGSARSSIDWWNQQRNYVGTAYVVDRDGTVLRAFDPKYWAWHLGIGQRAVDSAAIGIEIANWGPLKAIGGFWANCYGHRYTGPEPIRANYRGAEAWEPYPDAQIASVVDLVEVLCRDFRIPRVIPPLEKQLAFDPAWARQYRGIVAHQNYRRDKVDVGPAFPWEVVA